MAKKFENVMVALEEETPKKVTTPSATTLVDHTAGAGLNSVYIQENKATAKPEAPKPVENTTTTTTTTPTQTTTSTTTSPTPAVNKTPVYTPATLPTYTAQTDRVNELYDAALELQKAQLQNAYDKNVLAYEGAREKIPVTYQQERNAVAAESEKQKQAFNEYAAASGLNTGAGSQVELARSNQLQGNLSALRRAEADAQSALDMKLAELKVDYQNAVAQAIAQNDYEKAAALLDEYKLEQQSIVSVAQAQANENYRAIATQQAYEQEQYERRQAEIEADIDAEYRAAQLLQQDKATKASLEKAYIEALAQQRKDERSALEAKAKTLAQYGDFSGYAALGWTPQEIARAEAVWLAQANDEPVVIPQAGTTEPVGDPEERSGIFANVVGGIKSGIDKVGNALVNGGYVSAPEENHLLSPTDMPAITEGYVSTPEYANKQAYNALNILLEQTGGDYFATQQMADKLGITNDQWRYWYSTHEI